jgi:hypothetical protein
MRIPLILALLATPTLAIAQPAPGYAPPPPPTGPERTGFTAELSLGLGYMSVAPDGYDSVTKSGLSGLNVGLGGWISPKTAVTVRIAGTSFTENDVQYIAGLLGITAQQMVTENAWVGGGLGIGVLTTDQDNSEGERGLGLDLRAGYNFYQSRKNAFNVQVEVTPGFFDDGRVTGLGLQVGWQHL